jgi:hypothetical protein
LNNAFDSFIKGNENIRTIKDLRLLSSEFGQWYGNILGYIQQSPANSDWLEWMENDPDRNKYDLKDQAALLEYETKIKYNDAFYDPITDTKDWKAEQKAKDDFIEKYGLDVYKGILAFTETKKYNDNYPAWVIRLSTDKELLGNNYWKLPYKQISQMDKLDLASGMIPEEWKNQWEAYQKLDTKESKAAFIEANPDFNKDYRTEYRLAHPEDDARLALWGYGGKLQSRKAYDLVEKWSNELGIPFNNEALSMPPRSLIDNYFEYNKIIKDFSGVSAEAKLYRLEHPDWDQYGRDNLGLSRILDNINSLKISTQYRANDEEYDAYSDSESESYIEDEKVREIMRAKYLTSHTEYADARRRRDAYDAEVPDEYIEMYVEYYRLPEAGYEREMWLLGHQDYYKEVWRGILKHEPVAMPANSLLPRKLEALGNVYK